MPRAVRSPHPAPLALALAVVLLTSLTASPAGAIAPKPVSSLVPAPPHLPQTPTVDTTAQIVDLTFPVAQPDRDVRFIDDFLQERGGGSRLHAASDIMAPKHRPVHAAMGGRISWAPKLSPTSASPLGEPTYGWMLTIHGDDGLRYSYVHLNNDTPVAAEGRGDDDAGDIENAYAPRIVEAIRDTGSASGLHVERGELIGWVGDSGNAKGIASHLHLEIEVQGPDGPYRINPYHSLKAALADGDVPDATPATRQVGKAGYDDVVGAGTHTPAIVRLTESGVVTGCRPARYCPHVAVTRGDLAAFLASAKGLPTGTAPRFEDVAVGDPNAGAIAAVDTAGILGGYGDGSFGPRDPLSRAQLATVLVQAFDLPAAGTTAPFRDVPHDGVHAPNIAASHAAGLTEGCSDGQDYCGREPVTRGQIASFLVAAIDVTA